MKTSLVLLAAAASVSAHSTWQDLWVGSEDKATSCARTVKDNNPIDSLSSADMFCGRGPASSSGVCEVAGMFDLALFYFDSLLSNLTSWWLSHRRDARSAR